MSERRPADEMTDPGPPPEEALDATLRALGAPVPAQTRRTPESAGLDAAHYHAEPHRPPRAHEPPSSSKVATTEPLAAAQTPLVRDTVRLNAPDQRLDLTTVPRAAPVPSRMSTFIGALVVVVVVLGVATWALMRGGSPPGRPAVTSSAPTAGTGSAEAVIVPVPVPVPPAPVAAAALAASSDSSSATIDPPRPTGRPEPTSTPGTTALPRRAPTAAASAAAAPSPPPAVATAPVAPPAPTTKYNRFLEEDKK